MVRGEIRRVPQGIPEIKIAKHFGYGRVSNPPMGFTEYQTIRLLDKRFQYRTPLQMLEMKSGYDEYIMDSFIVMIQNHLQKVMSKGINIYMYKDTHQIDTEIVRDQKEYRYRYAIDEEDRYRIHFIDGVTDEALDNVFAEAKQVIDQKIDEMFSLNSQIRWIKSHGFCPVNTQQNAR